MLTGLNHLTLAVSDLDASLTFYADILGFTPKVAWQQGAYLTLGDLWLCLSVGEVEVGNDYTHYAFSIAPEHFASFRTGLTEHQVRRWKTNSSEGPSLYFLDPDGHRLEAHVGDLATRLASLKAQPYEGLKWL